MEINIIAESVKAEIQETGSGWRVLRHLQRAGIRDEVIEKAVKAAKLEGFRVSIFDGALQMKEGSQPWRIV